MIHKASISAIAAKLSEVSPQEMTQSLKIDVINDFPILLRELIQTARNNKEVDPKRQRYSETIRQFVTYM